MGEINNLGNAWPLLALLSLKERELVTVDLTFSALWYECSCNTWLLELDVVTSDVLITALGVIEIDAELLWMFDEGNGCHLDGLPSRFWFTNVVGIIDWGGKDIVTVLDCSWDPPPVVSCIIGWDTASIFSNCALEIFIMIGCDITLLDANELADADCLACNTVPTVGVVYTATGAAVVTGGVGIVYLVTGGWEVVNFTCDSVEIMDAVEVTGVVAVMVVALEFVPCILVKLTVAIGLRGFAVEASFFTVTSFGGFTTFLAATDAITNTQLFTIAQCNYLIG